VLWRGQLPEHPGRQHARTIDGLAERHELVRAVRGGHIAGAEDHRWRGALVDEEPHVGAIRLTEQLRAPTGDRFDRLGKPTKRLARELGILNCEDIDEG